MKPRKPDRFERIVGKGFRDQRYRPQDLILARDAVGLLRREHAWMRRMLKKYMKSIDGLQADLHPDFVCGYMQAGHEFMALLDQRRK